MNIAMIRSKSSRARLPSDTSATDMRNSFSAQRYPVRLCKSAHARTQRKPSAQPSAEADSILIPSVPIASTSPSEKAESRKGSFSLQTFRRHSSIKRPPSLTVGEAIEQLTLAEKHRTVTEEHRRSVLASHSDTEKEYLYLKKQWRQGVDISVPNPRLTSRCTCDCWLRSESIWRTFEGSIAIKLHPDAAPGAKGVGFEHYRKYLGLLDKSRKSMETRRLYRAQGTVEAG